MHPLPMHSNAMIAAEAAMSAHSQGKFFEMNELLLANQTTLTRDHIMQLATGLGLDMTKFTHELDTHAHKAEIDAMVAEALKAGASGTPANFVNGRFLSGAAPFERFKAMIDEAIVQYHPPAPPAQVGKTSQ